MNRPDGQCHREYTACVSQEARVRVKRWCKRPPREAQATRHGKPHRVQGQIGSPGAARSAFRESETGFGYWLLRQMILSTRKGADKNRLTALPKPFLFLPHDHGWLAQYIASIHGRDGDSIGQGSAESSGSFFCCQILCRPICAGLFLENPPSHRLIRRRFPRDGDSISGDFAISCQSWFRG